MQEIPSEWIKRAIDGDIDAFEQIYRVSSGFVYSIAFRYLQSAADAEEVTQDVFLQVHRNLKCFQERASFSTWVYRIAMNLSINFGKRSFRENARRADFEENMQSQKVPAEAHVKMDQESKEQVVQSMLQVLNPDQRACLVLRSIQGLNYQEIADVLKINLNTVRSRLKRARETLTEYAKKGVMSHGL